MNVLDELTPHYQSILQLMPHEFDSHQFIIALAHANQPEYVRALSQYTDVADRGVFRTLHSQISKSLHDYVDYIDDISSPDIFGTSRANALWRKR